MKTIHDLKKTNGFRHPLPLRSSGSIMQGNAEQGSLSENFLDSPIARAILSANADFRHCPNARGPALTTESYSYERLP